RRSQCRLVKLVVAAAQLGEGGTIVAMDGHEEAVGVETVHLDQPVPVRRGSIDDDEDEVLVVVDLWPLVEVLGVLDGERMELEDVAQELEIGSLRPVEVNPEELSGREEALDRLPAEVHRPFPVLPEDVALR